MKRTLFATLAIMALALMPAMAQQYGVQTTVLSGSTYSIATTASTNQTSQSTAVAATKLTDFALHIAIENNIPVTGSLDLVWQTAPTSSTFPNAAYVTKSSDVGWFSIPLTNRTGSIDFSTNITVNAVGYWRVAWLTNTAGVAITNLTIQAYQKPKRNG